MSHAGFSIPVKGENGLVALVCLVSVGYLVEPDYNRLDQRNRMNRRAVLLPEKTH